MKIFFSQAARRDVRAVLAQSRRSFGERQAEAYAALIRATIALIAQEPKRASSIARPQFGPNVRSLHLEIAAGRRGAASHVVVYQQRSLSGISEVVGILCVLHDAMDPQERIADALQELDERSD